MNEKFVYAVYDRIEEANKAVQNLTNAGIPVSAISLYADDDVIEEAQHTNTIVDIERFEDSDNRTFWNRITDFFGGREEHGDDYHIDFSAYDDEIDDDKILVVVEKIYEGEALSVNTTVNVMNKNDPNQYETYTQEDYPEKTVNTGTGELTDKTVEEETIIAGDMGVIQEDDDVQDTEKHVVAGDFSGETEQAEAYYSNIDSHRAVKKPKVESTKYEKNKQADDELRTKRQQASVAGDMGDYSDYSEYYQSKEKKLPKSDSENFLDESYYNQGEQSRLSREEAERKKMHKGISDVKRPVTQFGKTKQQLGEFEEQMRRHEEYPPKDEEGVNPDQFTDK